MCVYFCYYILECDTYQNNKIFNRLTTTNKSAKANIIIFMIACDILIAHSVYVSVTVVGLGSAYIIF